MNNVTPITSTPAVEKKRRTISLTNRRPVQIIEQDWPIVAEGTCAENSEDAAARWEINVRVRMNRFGQHIVYAKYVYENDIWEQCNQIVRVGRLVLVREDEEAALLAIADEMRARIDDEYHKGRVVFAFDACFASLGAQVM
jgi:hypothetical protein